MTTDINTTDETVTITRSTGEIDSLSIGSMTIEDLSRYSAGELDEAKKRLEKERAAKLEPLAKEYDDTLALRDQIKEATPVSVELIVRTDDGKKVLYKEKTEYDVERRQLANALARLSSEAHTAATKTVTNQRSEASDRNRRAKREIVAIRDQYDRWLSWISHARTKALSTKRAKLLPGGLPNRANPKDTQGMPRKLPRESTSDAMVRLGLIPGKK